MIILLTILAINNDITNPTAKSPPCDATMAPIITPLKSHRINTNKHPCFFAKSDSQSPEDEELDDEDDDDFDDEDDDDDDDDDEDEDGDELGDDFADEDDEQVDNDLLDAVSSVDLSCLKVESFRLKWKRS